MIKGVPRETASKAPESKEGMILDSQNDHDIPLAANSRIAHVIYI